MKRTYEKPTLVKRDMLQVISAVDCAFVSPFFNNDC